MKLTALDCWPPQDWKADTQILASEAALDATDGSASIPLNSSDVVALTVIHNNRTCSLGPGAGEFSQAVDARDQRRKSEPKARKISELEIESEVPQ